MCSERNNRIIKMEHKKITPKKAVVKKLNKKVIITLRKQIAKWHM